MISTNQFKAGMALVIDGELCLLVEYQHVKPGKGAAFVRTKLKSLKTGNVLNRTFDSGEKFQDAFIEKKGAQFLYRSDEQHHFMDLKSYDQMVFRTEDLGDSRYYLTDNMEVKLELWEGKLVGLELPTTVNLKIAESEPGLKGDTSKSAMKPAVLETGWRLQVPLFVGPGDLIKVDTRTGEYAGRA